MNKPLPSRPHALAQEGVVLVVVLVMLVVIAFMSVAVMRGSLTTDVVTNNNRTQTLATEMAQLALRFCQTDISRIGNTSTPAVLFTGANAVLAKSETLKSGSSTAYSMAWESKANWVGGTSKARTLTADQLKSTDSAFTPSTRPQCLAEYSPEAGTEAIIVLTVRGFSPDYSEDSNNHVTSGSVVWLQSRFLLADGS